eukprot:3772452-Rhodomonas_salina.2
MRRQLRRVDVGVGGMSSTRNGGVPAVPRHTRARARRRSIRKGDAGPGSDAGRRRRTAGRRGLAWRCRRGHGIGSTRWWHRHRTVNSMPNSNTRKHRTHSLTSARSRPPTQVHVRILAKAQE